MTTCLGGERLTGPAPASALWLPPATWGGAGVAWMRHGFMGARPAEDRQVHVLMIEDDPSIADMYRFQLEHDGYRVSVATTGEVGFSTLSGAAPDIVLLDLLLPDQSGFELLAALNERLPSHPPVVILSNYGEPSMIDRGRSLGALEYLVKSRVTPAEISHLIPTWIELGGRGGRTDS